MRKQIFSGILALSLIATTVPNGIMAEEVITELIQEIDEEIIEEPVIEEPAGNEETALPFEAEEHEVETSAIETIRQTEELSTYESLDFLSETTISDEIQADNYSEESRSALMAVSSGKCGENLIWQLTDGVLTISGSGTMYDYSASNLPEWYESHDQITSVNIGEEVQSIGSYAFYKLQNLTEITIPSAVKTISNSVFEGSEVSTVTFLGNNPPEIMDDSFKNVNATMIIPVACAKWVSRCLDYGGSLSWVRADGIIEWELCGVDAVCAKHSDGTLQISGTGPMMDEYWPWRRLEGSVQRVVIDEGITHIGKDAFSENYDLVEVIIPGSVESIGSYAFTECPFLKTVSIGHGLESIGDSAFWDCYRLETIDLPDSITQIGDKAFEACSKLKINSLPNQLKTINNSSFAWCDITEIIIPDSVKSIQQYAFSGCPITKITIPQSVNEIQSKAFSSSLKDITFTGNAPRIADDAFNLVMAYAYYPAGNSTWTSDVCLNYGGALWWVEDVGQSHDIAIPDNLCGKNATWTLHNDGTLQISGTGPMMDNYRPWHYLDEQIIKVVIDEGITHIGKRTFWDEVDLEEVVIPDSVESIGSEAFSTCENLKIVTIGNGLKKIEDAAFYLCPNLETISLPEIVESIGERAFAICGLKQFTIPEKLTTISNSMLRGCPLTEIVIPDSIKSIQEYALSGCLFKKITIPASVTEIQSYAFGSHYSVLQEIVFSGNAPSFSANTFNLVKAYAYYPAGNSTWTSDICRNYGGAIWWNEDDGEPQEITFPENLCGKDATWNLLDDGTLIISGTGEMMDNYYPWTFADTSVGIRKVIVEDGITHIGISAFSDNYYNLEEVVIAGSVESIGRSAFSVCYELKTVEIGEGVKKIGDYAFWECHNLETINFPNSVSQFGIGVLSGCFNIKKITLPGQITAIDASMVSDCYNLTEIIIPDSVTSIQENAFRGCSIKEINIPKNVKEIQSNAFGVAVKEITFSGNAPEIADDAFNRVMATAYYPSNNRTWTPDKLQNYGGLLTWVGYEGPAQDDDIPNIPDTDPTTEVAYQISSSIPERDGVTFAYWLDTATGVKYQPGDEVTADIYFRLDKVWNLDVIFDANGGTGAPAPIVATSYKFSIEVPKTVPTRNGYTFKGWSEKADATTTTIKPGSGLSGFSRYSDVTYYAVWEKITSFADVNEGAYYANAVTWAIENDITSGTGTNADGEPIFEPNATCTRAEAATFLWRLYGSPEPKSTASFSDVNAKTYYAKAVAWAVENGIIYGTDATHFEPNKVVNRQTVVTILYRAAGSPETTGNTTFDDVPTDMYYSNAVAWAVEAGVTSGLNESTFGLNAPCTRAQIVTLLYRFAEEK